MIIIFIDNMIPVDCAHTACSAILSYHLLSDIMTIQTIVGRFFVRRLFDLYICRGRHSPRKLYYR